jgi:hypothetical protein
MVLSQITVTESFDSKIERKVDAESNFKDLMLDIRQQRKALENLPDEDDINRALTKMLFTETFDVELDRKIKSENLLSVLLHDVKKAGDEIKTAQRCIAVYENQMPALCPTCGQSLKGDTCENRDI